MSGVHQAERGGYHGQCTDEGAHCASDEMSAAKHLLRSIQFNPQKQGFCCVLKSRGVALVCYACEYSSTAPDAWPGQHGSHASTALNHSTELRLLGVS